MIAENEIRQHHSTFSDRLMKGFKIDVKSSVGILFANIGGKLHYLLCRSTADDDRAGKLCFAGGGVDAGESPLQAAIREVYEETGLTSKPIDLIGHHHPSKPSVMFYALALTCSTENIKLNEEFSEHIWAKADADFPSDMMDLNKEIMSMIINKKN